jgi:hypothetical protein
LNTSHINTPSTGINSDLATINLSSKNYTYALNASVSDNTGDELLIQNTHSNILKATFPDGYMVISHKTIFEKDRVLYFLVNPTTNQSEIGEIINVPYTDITDQGYSCYDNGCPVDYNKEEIPLEKTTQVAYASYRTIVNQDCLNFNINYPIDIEYRITDCGINIYFTDNYNKRRFIYFEFNADETLKIKQEFYEITGFDPYNCNLPIYSTNLDCNKISYNPCFAKPCIDFVDSISNGSLKAGVYQFIIAYSDKNGNVLTNYFPATQPIPIFNKEITILTNYDTDKSIVLDINNIENEAFLYYNLVVVETIDNFTEFKLVGTFPTSFTQKDRYIYTGNDNTLQKLTAQDVLFKRPYYDTAKFVTKANNYLFFGGLKEYKNLNLQRVANNVKLYWQTIALPESVYKEERNSFHFRTFQRDEVYSFGIVFEFCDGWESCVQHIPGNSADYFDTHYGLNPYDIIPNSNPDVIEDHSCVNEELNKRWQVYNMAQKIPGMCEYKFTENCKEQNTWEAGDFGYHESTEKYPNDPVVWGELCDKPIRHHRMPDCCVTHIHDGQCGSKHFEESNIVYPIGVRVDHASVISALDQAVIDGIIHQEDRNKIVGYRIVRGNRQGHKSIVAKGLLYDMFAYSKEGKSYFYPNYPYNDLNPDYFISPVKSTYDQDSITQISLPNTKPPVPNPFLPLGRYTFHSPDTHFNNPSLGNILKLETVEYGQSEGFFNQADEQAKYKRMTFFARLIALGMGIAAALSATEEKECVTYTIKSNSKIYEDKLINNYDKLEKEENKIVNTNTVLGQTVYNNNIWDAKFGGNTYTDPRTNETDYSTCLGHNTYDKKTGNKKDGDSTNTIMTAAADAIKACNKLENDNVVENYTRTTCTGTTHQLLSNGQTGSGIMTVFNTILTALLGSGPQIVQQVLLGMKEMNIVLDLIKSLIPEKNYAIQYNSVGRYNNYVCVPDYMGIKVRNIIKAAYLNPSYQIINDKASTSFFTNTTVNNWNRESSVYLNVDSLGVNSILKPHEINPLCIAADNSKVTMGDYGANLSYKDLNVNFKRNIASYYTSIKNFVPDQYGKIHTIEYLETNGCTFMFDVEQESSKYTVFGGDTFINRFGLKRKMPFFTQTRFKQLNGSDVKYSELGNAGYPNYYFDSEQALFDRLKDSNIFISLLNPLSLLDEIVGLEDARLDVKTPHLFYQKGYIHVYNYGIPYFFVESDINVDYRYGQNNLEKDFYPHNQDLQSWLQEKNVPISEDNFYFYNKTYSKQNKESFLCNNRVSFEPNTECRILHPNRIIYSENQDYSTNDFDSWRVFKANSFYDFPLSDGKLISADGIESDKVLVRSENMTRIFAAYNTIATDAEKIQVDTGGLFQSRPKEFVVAELGYAGTQNKEIIHSEFGHTWVDAKRGNIFNLDGGAAGIDELSRYGDKNWFKENLPFRILKDFPNYDIDNAYNNVGITMCYDRRFNRLFLTKKDYKVISPLVKHEVDTNKFYVLNGQTKIYIDITDIKYFCDASWTYSYNYENKLWRSFHSFKPSYYSSFIDYFESGIPGSVWSHGLTNKSYQVYYGILYPFIIEYPTDQSASVNVINSIQYVLDTVRYHNEYDYYYNKDINFNELIISNEHQCTGIVQLVNRNKSDLTQLSVYPKQLTDRTQILATNSENVWKVNGFYDLTKSHTNNVPFFRNTCAADIKTLNQNSINYFKPTIERARIRAKQSKIRLSNSIYSNYSFKFNFSQTNQIKSWT